MKKLAIKTAETLRIGAFCVTLPMRLSPGLYMLYWLAYLTNAVIPAASLYLWKRILDGLILLAQEQMAIAALALIIAGYLLLNAVGSQLGVLSSQIRAMLTDKINLHVDRQVMERMAAVDVARFDDPKNQDTIQVCVNSKFAVTDSMFWPVEAVSGIVLFLSMAGLFFSFMPWLSAVFLVAVVPSAVFSFLASRNMDKFSIYSTPENRRKEYYKRMLTQARFAKDLRVYNLKDHIRDEYERAWAAIRKTKEALFTMGLNRSTLAALLSCAGYGAVLFFSIRSAATGRLSIGDLSAYTGAALSVSGSLSMLIQSFSVYFGIRMPRVKLYMDFLNWETESTRDGKLECAKLNEIRFEDVSFRYPNAKQDALSHLSFTMKKGEKIALVGVNGSGKTTLIKLLLRLYDPAEGRILINGVDAREYSIASLRGLFGACFQDVSRYALSLCENVTLSDRARADDRDAVWAALKEAGLDAEANAWEKGIDQPMTRLFEPDGKEFSGGQWQKVALARTFFRDSQMLILDEPSSALDAEAEDALFASFARVCRDKSGILVSHRLSGMMMVDRILVLEQGTAVEFGTHEELMRLKGRYAYLYGLQSEKYREAAGS